MRRLILPLALPALLAAAVVSRTAATSGMQTVSYGGQVAPFLKRHCAPCHFGGQTQGGLSLASVAAMRRGGRSGPAILPGKASASRLVLMMEGRIQPQMPPIPGAKPLDTRLLRRWIDQGAKEDKARSDARSEAAKPDQRPLDHRVVSAAFSPDGKLLAIGGYQTVTLLSASTGQELAKLSGHSGTVTAVRFSPDGRMLAAAGGRPGRSGEILLWNTVSRKTIARLSGHDDAVYGLAFSPAGDRIAAASYDQRLSLWTLPAAGRPAIPPRYLKDHTDAVYDVAWSRDGRLIASASGDRTVKVWSAATGKRLYSLSEAAAELYAVAFSPDGGRLAAGGVDKTLRVYAVGPSGGRLLKAAFAHDGPILRAVFSRDASGIFTAGEDRMVKRWDAATLAEQKVYSAQPDWPHAIALSPDGRLLAVGRHDGSVAIYEAETGRLLREPVRAVRRPEADVPTSSLIPGFKPGDNRRRPRKNGPITLTAAALTGISPSGARRGGATRFTLTGAGINDAGALFFDDPAISGVIVKPVDKNGGVLRVDAAIGPQTRIGLHRVFLQTPRGVTGSVTFTVGDWPEVAEAEPNNSLAQGQSISYPCTVTGAIDRPGDVDSFSVEARAGQELVFEVVAQPIRSRLQPALTLLAQDGRVVAESRIQPGKPDALLGYRFEASGRWILQLRDYEGYGGGDAYYRLNAGEFPAVTEVFPLGARAGARAEAQVRGFNLDGRSVVSFTAPKVSGHAVTLPLPLETAASPILTAPQIHIGSDPEVMATEESSLASGQKVTAPVTINGRLNASSHSFRFTAARGRPLVFEVMAKRLGSPLDSEIEIRDAAGGAVERAVLRAVGQTFLVLNDRDSSSTGLRLESWNDFHPNDYLLIGREVIRIQRLPYGPDEDVFFRSLRGQRLTYFGTTPEYHSVGAPVYKVEAHPPGSRFSPNGMPQTRLYYRNDDGGPLYGKDSYLEFNPPADGEYVVKLSDARGLFGEEFAYRLMIREPRPDFRLSMSPQHPNLPEAGAAIVDVNVERLDGFDEAIAVRLEGLPEGFTATETTIEPGESSASILIQAAPGAVTPPPSRPSAIRLVGRAMKDREEIVRTVEPEGGWRLLTVMPPPDIRVSTDRLEVALWPGEETSMEARVERVGEFGNRVPIEVRNLPFGVRVTDIGLNGILVTEEEDARRFTLYCEPWVKPQTRWIYVQGSVEGGVPNAARPVLLRIQPRSARSALRR